MTKNILLSLSLLALLQACGGGGGGDAGSAPGLAGETQAGANSGKVSAKFVPNNARYLLLSTSAQSFGVSKQHEQEANGAMVRIDTNTLSGDHQTVDIAGNAHFALGRWLKGTITRDKDTRTLNGKNNESYHYIVYNGLTELPASGKLQCKIEAATAPTELHDPGAKVGSASGSAHVSFDANGADIQGAIQVRAGAEDGKLDLATHIKNAGSMPIVGQMFGPGPGAGVVLAGQGSAVPGLVVGYKVQSPGGRLYLGVARFACSQA